MIGLLLFSHGSLLCGAGGALEAHAERLRRDHGFPMVEVGYLNYSKPPFEVAAARLASAGATRIVVVPFFLAPGYFVTHSLPKCVEAVRPLYPDIEFLVASPLGADERIAEAVLESAGATHLSRPSPPDPLSHRGERRNRAECDALLPFSLTREKGLGNEGEEAAALLVMVHGSPKAEANDEMFQVVETVKARGLYSIVEVGFMECNEPAIPDAIESCIGRGAQKIVAVPYFLHMGAHVAEDLPALLDQAQEKHPGVEFLMGEYIGNSEKLTGLLAERAREALTI